MSKKRKDNLQRTAKTGRASARKSGKKSTHANKRFWQLHTIPALVLFALGILLYIMSVSYDFALDDQLYITGNQFTQEGFGGMWDLLTKESLIGFWGEQKDLLTGGRYRPLALLTYAFEYQLYGESAGMYHFWNLILYGFTGILLYRVLLRLFPPLEGRKWWFSLPFAATLLYMVHPLHTEVVASVKGRVEILAFLGALSTLWFSLKYVDTRQNKWLIFSGIAFFLALLSKETAITFLAVVPLSIYFFTSATPKKNAFASLTLLGVTAVYLLFRYQIIGYLIGNGEPVTELLNNPFVNASAGERLATVFYTWGLYIAKLFVPITLTHDYYPKDIPIVGWSDPRAFLSFGLFAALTVYAVWGMFRKSVIAYGILFFLITFSIVSNLLINVGAFMNERFMYFASLGFCIAIAYLIVRVLPNALQSKFPDTAKVTGIVLLVLAGSYAVRTLVRVPAWKNNETLFLTDVHNSPNSTKVNTSAGGVTIEKAVRLSDPAKKDALMREGVKYLNKALEIYPENTNALLLLASAHHDWKHDYDKIVEAYSRLIKKAPHHNQMLTTLNIMAEAVPDAAGADKLINFIEQQAVPNNPNSFLLYDALGVMYGKKKNDLDGAIRNFEKAVALKNDAGTLQDLATAYGMKGNFQKSVEIGKRALQLDPNNARLLLNLSVGYRSLGQQDKADHYYTEAVRRDPSLKQK